MNIRRISIFAAAWLLAPALWAPAVRAQDTSSVERFDRQLQILRRDTRLQLDPEIPVSERTYLDYGGYFSFTYLSLDTPQLKNETMRQEELGAYADVIFDNAHEFLFRGRLFHRDFNPGDRFNSDGEGIDGRIDRLFYRFDLERYEAAYKGVQTQSTFSVKLGRDLVLWGNGLTLSSDMDGGVVDLGYKDASLELIAGVTPLDTVDFDSSRPRFDSRTERGLFGAIGSMRVGTNKLYAYGLNQRDYNNDELTASDQIDGAAAIPTRFHYDSHYVGIGASGALTDRLSYGVEAVYEGGHTLSSSFTLDDKGTQSKTAQTRDGIAAYALDARLDYVFTDPHHTRVSGEVLFASGDTSRVDSTTSTYGGNVPGTTDRAFNALGLSDVGTAFSPNVSNLMMFRVGASTSPFNESKMFRQMQIGAEFYAFAKMVMSAPIDEETSTGNRWLGIEPDVYLNWQLTSDVTLSARYGVFIPGDAIINDGKMRQFIYTQVTFAF